MIAYVGKDFMATHDNFPTWSVGLPRLAARLAVILLVALLIHYALERLADYAAASGDQKLMLGALALLLVSYALLIAIPFMPGVEIGISLLILQGASIAPFVYLATVAGLMLAYLAGRFTPYAWLAAVLRDMRWRGAYDFVERLEPMNRSARIAHLTSRLPARAQPMIKTGRYVLLAILINLPGNSIIGGGGIAFVAGFSRLYSPGYSLLAVMLAVLPVPLVVWLSGVNVLL